MLQPSEVCSQGHLRPCHSQSISLVLSRPQILLFIVWTLGLLSMQVNVKDPVKMGSWEAQSLPLSSCQKWSWSQTTISMYTVIIVHHLLLSSKSRLSNARGAVRTSLAFQLESEVSHTLTVPCSRLLLKLRNTLHKA